MTGARLWCGASQNRSVASFKMSCDLGIACYMSSHLETGVPQRDSRVWLHPKRCLACPLGSLPMKPNGARRRRRMDVPRRGTIHRSGQYANCAKRYSVSSFRAKREIFVIRGPAVNDWKFQTGNLLSTYLRASPRFVNLSGEKRRI